jgi:hypothetical protein
VLIEYWKITRAVIVKVPLYTHTHSLSFFLSPSTPPRTDTHTQIHSFTLHASTGQLARRYSTPQLHGPQVVLVEDERVRRIRHEEALLRTVPSRRRLRGTLLHSPSTVLLVLFCNLQLCLCSPDTRRSIP